MIGFIRALAVLTAAGSVFAIHDPASAQTSTKYYARQIVSPASAAPTTFSWETGSVDAGCSLLYRKRSLTSTASCRGSDGSLAPDSKCTGSKPASGVASYGAACTPTAVCANPASGRSGIQSESYISFTAATEAEGIDYCQRTTISAWGRIGTCTRVSGTSWRVYGETNGTQAAPGQTSWPCQMGPGTVR